MMALRRWLWFAFPVAAVGVAYAAYATGVPLMWQESTEKFVERVRAFGPWVALISIFLLVLETAVPPIPAAPILIANAVLFGVPGGILLSWVGSLLGAIVNFWLARRFGRHFLVRRLSPAHLAWIDRFSEEKGFQVLLIARMIPLTSVDFIGFLAGLSSISFPRYVLASAIGLLPGVTMYTLLAHDIFRANEYLWRIGAVAAAAGLVYFLSTRRELVAAWVQAARLRRERAGQRDP